MSNRDFVRLDGRTVFEGHIITVGVDRFRFADGTEVSREVVRHPGAAGVVVLDGDELVLVLQPREGVGDPDSLELPAGRLDKPGEEPLQTARRELAEEVGLQAATWDHLHSFRSSCGMTDEVVHVYLATDVAPCERPPVEEDERIEIVRRPLGELDALIAEVTDAKTIIGLLHLRARLHA